MIKKGLKILGALLIFFAVVIIANEFQSQYLGTAIEKIRGRAPSILMAGVFIFAICKIIDVADKYYSKRTLKNKNRNEKYRCTELLMKSYLEEYEEKQEIINTNIDEIEKRQEIIKILYDKNGNVEKRIYDDYKGYYNEIEKHFCESEVENWELELWDLRVVICEMKRRDYRITDEVLNKLEKLCNKITHNSDMEEWTKISYIACLDELSELIKTEEMQGRIKLALNSLNKKRIHRNMLKKYSRYIPDKIKPCKPRDELEYYVWYLPYMIQKRDTLQTAVICRYIKFLDNSYNVLEKEILENRRHYSKL